MATARNKLIDAKQPLHYHLTSRCVRSAFLCGKHKPSGKDYSYRKSWIEERMRHLAQYFALEIDAYAIMSNHFHLVIYYDPLANKAWSDAEVAFRWTSAFPPHTFGQVDEVARRVREDAIAHNPDLAASRRKDLGSVSMFMKYLKQPIAVRANQEDGVTGHFWEQRFYSGAILDEESLMAAMAYVDLNPVRAHIAKTLEDCEHTAVRRRLRGFENTEKRLKQSIRPIVSGLGQHSYRRPTTLARYLKLLTDSIKQRDPEHSVWARRIASIGKTQRAYGAKDVLDAWLQARKLRPLESPLPE